MHVPLSAADDFDAARDFALSVARKIVDRLPELATTEQRQARRGGRIYLDVMRNAYAQLAVAPYSVRARRSDPWAPMRRRRFGLSRACRAVARMAA